MHDSPVDRDTTGRPAGSPVRAPESVDVPPRPGGHEPAPPPGADRVDELARELGRLADRLRSLSDVRLARPSPGRGSRADQAHALAQRLADDAAALSGEPSRAVPRLSDLAVGDQVAVTGNDLLAAAVAARPAGAGAADAELPGRLADALLAVRELRSTL